MPLVYGFRVTRCGSSRRQVIGDDAATANVPMPHTYIVVCIAPAIEVGMDEAAVLRASSDLRWQGWRWAWGKANPK